MKRFRPNPLYWAILLGIAVPGGHPALAGEIAYDGTLKGRNLDGDPTFTQKGKPNFKDNVWAISVNKEGIRSSGGKNVFFSFGKFKVDQGEIADFNCAGSGCGRVQNLISRVGVINSEKAEIYGRVQETGLKANFWMMSPNGVVLGESGMIDVPGALHVGTGSSIEFPNGKFAKDFGVRGTGNARAAAPADVTTASSLDANPKSFGFLGGDDGTIEVGQPPATPGTEPLRLHAQGITLAAKQVNVSGNVELAGAGGNGASDLAVAGENLKPSVQILPGGRIVSAGSFTTAGDLGVAGSMQVGSAEVAGKVTVAGDLKAGSFDTAGDLAVAGTMQVASADVAGEVEVPGNLQAASVAAGGAVAVSGTLQADRVESGGAVTVTGVAQADSVAAQGDVAVNGGGKLTVGSRLSATAGEVRVGDGASTGTVTGTDGKSLAVSGKAVIVQQAGSVITKSGAGDLSVTATGSDAASSAKHALEVSGGGRIEASNTGSLTVESKAGSVVLAGPTPAIRKTSDGGFTVKAGETLTVSGGWSQGLAGDVTLEGGAVVVEGGALAKTGRGDLKVKAVDADGTHADEAGQRLGRALTLREGGRIEAANSGGSSLTVESAGAIDLEQLPTGLPIPLLAPNIAKTTDGNLTIAAGRTLAVSGGWSHGLAGDVTLQGGAVLIENGRLSKTGNGALRVTATAGDGANVDRDGSVLAHSLTLRNGGQLVADNGTDAASAADLEVKSQRGGIALDGTSLIAKNQYGGLTVDADGGLAVGGAVRHDGIGNAAVSGGSVAVGNGGLIAKTGDGDLTVDSQTTVAVAGGVNHGGNGALLVRGGSVAVTGAGAVIAKGGTGSLTVETAGQAAGARLAVRDGGRILAAHSGAAKVAGGLIELEDGRITGNNAGSLELSGGAITLDGGTIEKTAGGDLSVAATGTLSADNGSGIYHGNAYDADPAAPAVFAAALNGDLTVEAAGGLQLDGGSRIVGNHNGSMTVGSGDGTVRLGQDGGLISKIAGDGRGGGLTVAGQSLQAQGAASSILLGSSAADPAAADSVAGRIAGDLRIEGDTIGLSGGAQVIGNGGGDMTVQGETISLQGGRLLGHNGGSLTVTGGDIVLDGGVIAKTAGGDLTVKAGGDLTAGNGSGIYDGSDFSADPAAVAGFTAPLSNGFEVGAAGRLLLEGGSRIVGNHDGAMRVSGGTIQVGQAGGAGLIAKIAGAGRGGDLTVSGRTVAVAGSAGGVGSAILSGSSASDPSAIATDIGPNPGQFTVEGESVGLSGGGRIVGHNAGDMVVSAGEVTVQGGRIVGHNGGSLEVNGGDISLDGGFIEKTAGGDLTVDAAGTLTATAGSGIYDGNDYAALQAAASFATPLANAFAVSAGTLLQLDGGSRIVGNHDGAMTVSAFGGTVQVGQDGGFGQISKIGGEGRGGDLTVSGGSVEVRGNAGGSRSAILLGAAAADAATLAAAPAGGDLKVAGSGAVGILDGAQVIGNSQGDLVIQGGAVTLRDGRIAGNNGGSLAVSGSDIALDGGVIEKTAGGDVAVAASGELTAANGSAIHDGNRFSADPAAKADFSIPLANAFSVSAGSLLRLDGGSRIVGNHDGAMMVTSSGGTIQVGQAGSAGLISKIGGAGRGGDLTVSGRTVAVAGSAGGLGSAILSGSSASDPSAIAIEAAPNPGKFTVEGESLGLSGGGRIVGHNAGDMVVSAGSVTVQGGRIVGHNGGSLEVNGGDIGLDGGFIEKTAGGDLTVAAAGTLIATAGSGIYDGNDYAASQAAAGFAAPLANAFSVSAGTLLQLNGASRIVGNHDGAMAVSAAGGTVQVGQDGGFGQISKIGGEGRGGDLTVSARSVEVRGNVGGSRSAILLGAAAADAAALAAAPAGGDLKVAGSEAVGILDGAQVIGNSQGDMVIQGGAITLRNGRIAGNNGGSLAVSGSDIALDGGVIEKTSGGNVTVSTARNLSLARGSAIYDGSTFNADPAAPAIFGTALVNEFEVSAGNRLQLDGGSRIVGNHDGAMTVNATGDAIQVGQSGSPGLISKIGQTGGRGDLTVMAPRVQVSGEGSAILLGGSAADPSAIATRPRGGRSFDLPLAMVGDLLVEATGDDPARGSALSVTDRGRIVGNNRAGQGREFRGNVVVRAVEGSRGGGKKHRSTVSVDGGTIQKFGPSGDLNVSGGDVAIVDGGRVVMGNLVTSGSGPSFQSTDIAADNLDRSTGKLTITALNSNSLTVGSRGNSGQASYVLSTSDGGIDLASGRRINLGRGFIVENSGSADGGNILFRSASGGQPIRVTVNGFARVMNIGAGAAGNSILFERGPSVMTFETGRSIFQTLTGPGKGGTNYNPLRYGWTVQDYQAAELQITRDPLQDMNLPDYLSSVGFAATSQSKLGDFPTGIVRSLERVVIGQWQTPIDLDSIVANPCGRPGSSLVMQGLAGYAADPSAIIPSPAGEPVAAAGGFVGADDLRLAYNDGPAAVECDRWQQ